MQSNLVQLGITEYDANSTHPLQAASARIFGKVLASDFDVLILDEPTNHRQCIICNNFEKNADHLYGHRRRYFWMKCRTASSGNNVQLLIQLFPFSGTESWQARGDGTRL